MRKKHSLWLAAFLVLAVPSFLFAFQNPGTSVRPDKQAPLASLAGSAAPAEGGPVNISLRGLNRTISGSPVEAARSFLDEIKASFKMKDAYQETGLRTAQSDAMGGKHIRFDQFYQGLPVVGSQVIVHINQNNVIYQVNGRYAPDIDISTTPSISSDQAQALGLALFSGKTGLEIARAPELVVYPHGNRYFLAYHLVVAYNDRQGDAGNWVIYLDAATGEVIHRYNDLKYVSAPSTGGAQADITGYRLTGEDGTEITVPGWHETTSADTYYLYNKSSKWYVYNASTSDSYTDFNTYAHRLGTANWGTSDRVETSAAKNWSIIQDYFSTVCGRNSFDDAGSYAVANVHYGSNYVNAFWDSSVRQLYFGDGNGSTANPLAVLDIMAHEFGHAWTDDTSNLYYDYVESGALNESFSDITGCNIEFYGQADNRADYPSVTPGTADWLMGEDSWLSSTALRDMRNPSNAVTVGLSGVQPSRYHGTNWDDYEEMHTNDGVQNFFYYLLCEGGSGTNDGLPYSVTGIGIDNARRVAYQTNTYYLGSSETYYSASQAWSDAANDLNSTWTAGVKAAWAACGLIDVPASPYQDFESTSLPALCTTGGDADWLMTTSSKVQGSRSVRAGAIANSQSSYLQWTGYLDADGTVSFFVRVSSEKDYDFLTFSIDGVPETKWSGDIPWTSYCSALTAGLHTLTWTYAKDTAYSDGSDTAWVDALSFSAGVVTHTITASYGSNGTLEPSGDVLVGHNTSVVFTITPDSGYHLSTLLVDGSGVDTESVLRNTFTAVTGDHTIAADFAADTPSDGGGGGGGGGGGALGPLAAGLSVLLNWRKRRKK